MRYILLAGCMTWMTCWQLHGQEKESKPSNENESKAIEIAKTTVAQIKGVEISNGKAIELMAIGPLYTFVDPSRVIASGTIWAWASEGRPAVIMSLASVGRLRYCEFHSFSDRPLEFQAFGTTWRPSSAWKPTEIPHAPVPESSAPRRLSQMKKLLDRFRSSEDHHRTGRTDAMRILPQPIYRYPAQEKQHDGAVFLIIRDGDPEGVLVIETKPGPAGLAGWQFMAGTMTAHIVTVFLDEQPFKLDGTVGPSTQYFKVSRIADPSEL